MSLGCWEDDDVKNTTKFRTHTQSSQRSEDADDAFDNEKNIQTVEVAEK